MMVATSWFFLTGDIISHSFAVHGIWHIYANLCKWRLPADMTVSYCDHCWCLMARVRHVAHCICCTCCILRLCEHSVPSHIGFFVERFTFMHILNCMFIVVFHKTVEVLVTFIWWNFSLYFVLPLFLQLVAWAHSCGICMSYVHQAFVQ